MPLSTKTFQQFVDDQSAAWGAALDLDPVLIPGDPVLAVFEVWAAQLMFMQALALQINKLARLSTAENGDVDTWLSDFKFTRLPSTKATGEVTFSTAVPKSVPIPIPAGSIVQTCGGAITYLVIPDTDQPTWDGVQNAYILAAGQLALDATVEALIPGTTYNVQRHQLRQIGSSLSGISAVTNEEAIISGEDAETDDHVRYRFYLWLNSLEKSTRKAVLEKALGVQLNIEINPLENIDIAGNSLPGNFVLVVDDGSGSPSAELLSQVHQAVETVRGWTISHQAIAVQVVETEIEMDVRLSPTVSDIPGALAAVELALAAYVNQLAIGETLYLSKLIQLAISSSIDVIAVEPDSVRIDRLEADKVPTQFQRIKTNEDLIVVGTY